MVSCFSSATPNPTPNLNLVAFPGAEGFGAKATGGRGGRVIYVTNLEASGAGSLQDALDQTGARTILFKVSGVIQGWPTLERGDVTIAGQSSPGGIILRGLAIQGDVVCEQDGCPLPVRYPQNFIVRYLRMRPAASSINPSDVDDALRLHRTKLGIIDHVSTENANDESMQISMSSDLTIQNSMLAETLGDHVEFGGMLMAYSDPNRGFPQTRISIHHNVFNRIFGRMPELNWENFPSNAGSTMQLEYSNNLIWDHHRPLWIATTNAISDPPDGPTVNYQMNVVGNYAVQTPNSNFGLFTFEGPNIASTNSQLFFSDNHINKFSGVQDFQLVYGSNDFNQAVTDMSMPYPQAQPAQAFVRSSRHDFPIISYTQSGEPLIEYALKNVGAFPRDAMDRRLMGFVQSRSFDSTPLDTNPANDAFQFDWVNAPSAPTDSDNDGMPNAWEVTNGLSPNVADNNGTNLSQAKMGVEGYTNLEVYLDELAKGKHKP